MSQSDNDVTALKKQIRVHRSLLAEVLPVLTAYYEQMKARTDRSAIHQVDPQGLKELIDRVSKNAGN